MECPHIPELSYTEFGKRLREKLAGQRVPIRGSFELTFRCNLRCVHCYLDDLHAGIPNRQELNYSQVCNLLDQVADQGCLWLLLTGGEIFVRPDALDIYTYAKRKGFLVTLFTNGTLINQRVADYLAEWPPHVVEITLYGHTQKTYERITGVPGSHARCMQAIDLLLERRIPFKLKTMLMRPNMHEFWDMKAYAESLGLRFRYDPLLNAGVRGSKSPFAFRLSPEEIVQFDQSYPESAEGLREFCANSLKVRADPRYLYVCGAGISSFHIDPYGMLSLCLMSRAQQYDTQQGSFAKGWNEFLPRVRYQPVSENYACNACELLGLCGQCPGWAQMEHGDPTRPVQFLCQVARLRAQTFGAHTCTEPGVREMAQPSVKMV